MTVQLQDIEIDRAQLGEIAKSCGLDLVILFGSYAKGRETARSDLDVAVLVAQDEAPRPDSADRADWEMALLERLGGAIRAPEGIDLVLLNRASALLLIQVAEHGELLYERRAGAFRRFKSYAARRYDNDHKYFERRRRYLARRCEQWSTKQKSLRS